MEKRTQRYTAVAIALHWCMAAAFILMLLSGVAMTQEDLIEKSLRFKMYQWHKSLGVFLLVAFFVRIGWRLYHYPPQLPDHFKKVEIGAAKAGHWALYACMILMPLSGWVMVSSSPYGLPTIVFNLFTWPHIPGIAGNEDVNGVAKLIHEVAAWGFAGLIALHVAAVAKHALFDRENLLRRMWFNAVLLLALSMSFSSYAADYTVNYENSAVHFSGTHADKEFKGVFGEWQADIQFDPDNLESSGVKVVFITQSMKTGDAYYDSTLPSSDWMDSRTFREAIFESTGFTKKEEGVFQTDGILTIRGQAHPITFDFALQQDDQTGQTKVTAIFPVNRLSYGIGLKSDPNAEWVGESIEIQVIVVAEKAKNN